MNQRDVGYALSWNGSLQNHVLVGFFAHMLQRKTPSVRKPLRWMSSQLNVRWPPRFCRVSGSGMMIGTLTEFKVQSFLHRTFDIANTASCCINPQAQLEHPRLANYKIASIAVLARVQNWESLYGDVQLTKILIMHGCLLLMTFGWHWQLCIIRPDLKPGAMSRWKADLGFVLDKNLCRSRSHAGTQWQWRNSSSAAYKQKQKDNICSMPNKNLYQSRSPAGKQWQCRNSSSAAYKQKFAERQNLLSESRLSSYLLTWKCKLQLNSACLL